MLFALVLASGATAQRVAPCSGGPIVHVTVAPVMPASFNPDSVQAGADCLSWQMFIYLNWRASPARAGAPSSALAATFGRPGDTAPTVWQSYPTADAVFDPAGAVAGSRSGGVLALHDIHQTGDTWLTAQSGLPTYYEVRVNPDVAEFITQNGLTTAAGQAACARGKGGFNLPHGSSSLAGVARDTDCAGAPHTYGLDVGAIEIKAAWVVLPADGSLDHRYKIAKARVTDPATGKASLQTVGLAGLHIVRKLPGASQMLWATFEQIDTVPDQLAPARAVLPVNAPAEAAPRGFTYYNPACVPATDAYGCVPNTPPGAACRPGSTTVPAGCHATSAPMQITRLTPITPEVNDATADAWAAMRRQLPAGGRDSVFNYYRLIDVQWPAQEVPPVAPRARIPLLAADMIPTPDTRYVANTTMETFVQQSRTCLDCHANAAVANPALVTARALSARTIRGLLRGGQGAPFASDYAFVFSVRTRR